MVDFRNFIGRGTAAGSKLNIFAKVMFFVNVGSGEFIDLTASQAAFKGKIDTVLYKGDLSLTLKLHEDGKAEVTLNGSRASQATYTASGSKLTIEAKLGSNTQTITFEPGGKGNVETFLGVKGTQSLDVHLAPAGKPAVA
jgi:flagellar hook assembly protein FlgD